MSVENGAWKDGEAQEQTKPSAWGIHDNPVNSNHTALSHWKKIITVEMQDTYHMLTMKLKGDGWAGKNSEQDLSSSEKRIKSLEIQSWAVKSRRPCTNPPATPISLLGRLLASFAFN